MSSLSLSWIIKQNQSKDEFSENHNSAPICSIPACPRSDTSFLQGPKQRVKQCLWKIPLLCVVFPVQVSLHRGAENNMLCGDAGLWCQKGTPYSLFFQEVAGTKQRWLLSFLCSAGILSLISPISPARRGEVWSSLAEGKNDVLALRFSTEPTKMCQRSLVAEGNACHCQRAISTP